MNALSGRYRILRRDGAFDVVTATPDQLELVRFQCMIPVGVPRGYAWINPADYGQYPVTGVVTSYT